MSNFGDAPFNVPAIFPGPLDLDSTNSSKHWWLVAGSGAFTAACLILLVTQRLALPELLIMSFGALFFGLCGAVSLTTLLPGASSLKLHETGFDLTKFFRTRTFDWNDVRNFNAWYYSKAEMVLFDQTAYPLNGWEKFNVGFSGSNAFLPDTYGLSATALANLMTEWRTLALAKRSNVAST